VVGQDFAKGCRGDSIRRPASLELTFRATIHSMRIVVATILGNLTLFVASMVFGALAIIAGQIPPRGEWVVPVARAWARCLLWSAGVRLETSFEQDPDPQQRYVFMANHQSLYDIPVLLASLPVSFRFLAKASLFKIPIFGWSLSAAGFVPVDRKQRGKASEVFSKSLGALEGGASLVIFPEETRSLDGRLKPFQRGGFLMALKSGMSIVPVGIHGTLGIRRKGSLRIEPGVVKVSIGRPIEASQFGLRRKAELISTATREVGRLAGIDS
jgi:1-acyl-sn-glycerol-3-phosphate acyltransferase